MKSISIKSKFFDQTTLNFYNNKAFLFGKNNSKKSLLLNEIYQGLLGKKIYDLKFNEFNLNTNDYQIIYLQEIFELNPELKISKTSTLKDNILKYINKQITENKDYSLLDENLTEINSKLVQAINDFFNEDIILNEFLSEINFKTDLFLGSIETIIEKLMKINLFNKFLDSNIEEKNYSKFLIRLLILKIIFKDIDFNDRIRPIFILMDLPDACSDDLNLVKFKNWINSLSLENIYWIISINNSNSLKLLDPDIESINYIKNKIVNINNVKKIIKNSTIAYSFIEGNYTDIDRYKLDINKIITDSDLEKEYVYFKKYLSLYLYKILIFDEVNLIESEKQIYHWEINSDNQLKLLLNYKDLIYLYLFSYEFMEISKIILTLKNEKLINLINYII